MFGFGRKRATISPVEAATGLVMLVWAWDLEKTFIDSGHQYAPPGLQLRREFFLLQVFVALKGAQRAFERQPRAFAAVASAIPIVHASLVELLAPAERGADARKLMPNLSRNLDGIRATDPSGFQRMQLAWEFAPPDVADESTFALYESSLQTADKLQSLVRAMENLTPVPKDPILRLVLSLTLKMTYDVAVEVAGKWTITTQ